jgi:glyoxylase I family protein
MTTDVTSIGHIALRVTDLPRAKHFYAEQLGWVLARETDRACFVSIGGIILVLIAGTEQTRAEDRFDPFRIGLDHLALAVSAADFRGSNGDWTPPVCETMVSNTTTNPERTR